MFDFDAFYGALNAQRRERELDWYTLADVLWEQSDELNAQRPQDSCLCGGAVGRLQQTGKASCQYALFMLRWLDRAPEDFLVGDVVDVGDTSLPQAGHDARLRFNLNALHSELNDARAERGLTWAALAGEIGCTPNRLTNLKTARLADLDLTLRVTQWLGRPAAAFIHAADW